MKSIKTVAVALLAAALFSSCSEEQSSFNIEDVPGRCTFQGKIVYNQGTTYENGKFVYDYKPLADTEVTVTLDNNSFGSYQGVSKFTTTTDSQGNYSIEVPAPARNISATITTPDFLTERRVVKKVNNKVVTVTEEVVMRGNYTVSHVHGEGIVLASFACVECNHDNSYLGYEEYASFCGTIGQNVEYKVNAEPVYDEEGYIYGYKDAMCYNAFTPVANADLIIEISYPDDNVFTYNTTTDSRGNFNLEVPVSGYPAAFNYDIKVMPYSGDFIHYQKVISTLDKYFGGDISYFDYVSHTLKGYYSQSYSIRDKVNLVMPSEVGRCNNGKVMIFRPYDDGQDIYGYSPYNFNNDLEWLEDLKNQLINADKN